MYKNIIKYILLCFIMTLHFINVKANESQKATVNTSIVETKEKKLNNLIVNTESKISSDININQINKNETPQMYKNLTLNEDNTNDLNSIKNKTQLINEDDGQMLNINGDGWSSLNNGALLRGFYVFIGLGALVVLYIIIKIIKLKRKRAVRKYGILANNDDVVEMTPLGVDDEDEDMTLFEINSHTRS